MVHQHFMGFVILSEAPPKFVTSENRWRGVEGTRRCVPGNADPGSSPRALSLKLRGPTVLCDGERSVERRCRVKNTSSSPKRAGITFWWEFPEAPSQRILPRGPSTPRLKSRKADASSRRSAQDDNLYGVFSRLASLLRGKRESKALRMTVPASMERLMR